MSPKNGYSVTQKKHVQEISQIWLQGERKTITKDVTI